MTSVRPCSSGIRMPVCRHVAPRPGHDNDAIPAIHPASEATPERNSDDRLLRNEEGFGTHSLDHSSPGLD